jgi:hypothetical protein
MTLRTFQSSLDTPGISFTYVSRRRFKLDRNRLGKGILAAAIFFVVAFIILYVVAPPIMSIFDEKNSNNAPSTIPRAYYDLQLAEEFYGNYSSLSYNVTAIPQTDSYGYGPAYLLNGLSNYGYWYQVGLSWNWPKTNESGYYLGFEMVYDVFPPSGNSIYPANGAGIKSFSGTVNANDSVHLDLYFSSGSVVMYAIDLQTNATAYATYYAYGATYFEGLPYLTTGKTFTGLMTEWYHVNSTVTYMKNVVYAVNGPPISMASFAFDELNFTNDEPYQTPPIFEAHSNAPTSFTYPSQLQTITLVGIVVQASGYEFIT